MSHANATPDPAQQRPMLEVLRHAPRPVWVLIAGTFVNRVGSYFATFVVLFLTERGFDASALPLVLAAIGASALAGSLAGGWLADSVGRKRSLMTSMTASGLALVALSLVSGHAAIVAVVCVVAFCTQSYIPAAAALLVDHSDPVDRVPLFALFRVALNLGAAIGPLVAGVMAATSYDLLFVVDSATCLLFAVVLAVGLPAAQMVTREPSEPRERAGWRRRLRPAGGRPSSALTLLCLGIVGVTMIYAQHTSTLPLQLTDNGMTTQFFGLLLACNGFLVVLCELPLASVTRRYAPHRPMIAGALLMGAGMAFSGLLSGAVLIVVAVLLWTLGEMVLTPVVSSAVAELSSPDRIARDQGRLAAAQTLGFSAGPVVGVLAYAAEPVLPWLGCLVIGAASATAIGLAHRVASRAGTVDAEPPPAAVATAAAPAPTPAPA